MTWDAQGIEVGESWSGVQKPAQGGDLRVARPHAIGRWSKRTIDLLIAITALLLLFPLFLIVAIIVKLGDKGPVFYSHTRIGFGGAAFGCLKFRTMKTDASAQLAHLLQTDRAARTEWEATRKLKNDPQDHGRRRVSPKIEYRRASATAERRARRYESGGTTADHARGAAPLR